MDTSKQGTIAGYDTRANQTITNTVEKGKIIGRLSVIVAPGKKGDIVVREGEESEKSL